MKPARKPFPERRTEAADLISELKAAKKKDVDWRKGKLFGYIYYPDDDSSKVVEEAYNLFRNENALNPSLFASLKKFENETVQMMADLLNAGPDATGSLTTGGTESILMAVKTARDKARAEQPEIKCPEIIVPDSAHPAFDKASHYLNVRLIHTPVNADKRADVDAMRKTVTNNTILIAGSAPCYPHGVIDPIAEIGKLAVEKNLLFHVDACMGGLMLPFAERLGYIIPPFDFRVPGVTSISADIHKYGYAPKGASVVLYNSHRLRRHQFFICTDWSGGLYCSPTYMGTRCGGPIAAAWASLVCNGYEGYMKMTDEVMKASERIRQGINSIPGLYVVGNPEMSVFAFTSDQFDIFEIGDKLTKEGWILDRIQFPGSLHMTISFYNVKLADAFIEALKESVLYVSNEKGKSRKTHFIVSFVRTLSKVLPEPWFRKISSAFTRKTVSSKDESSHGMSAVMYGLTEKIENRDNVRELVLDVMDNLYY